MSLNLKDLFLPILKGIISSFWSLKEVIFLLILIFILKSLIPMILRTRSVHKSSPPQSHIPPSAPLLEEDIEQTQEQEEVDFANLPYKPKFDFLSNAEMSFFKVLLLATSDYNVHIFTKVRLADLVYLSKNSANWRTYFNKVQSKHVDFVVCDSNNVKPLFVVELDDSSHNQDKRIYRDDFVDNVLNKAGLPILRIPAQYTYSVTDISSKIQNITLSKEEVVANSSFEI